MGVEIICLHGYVTGRVQGVWYRDSTQRKALQYGLLGWVRNLEDGRVEVMLQGSRDSVQQLKQWLHDGPPLAVVTWVDLKQIPVSALDGFHVR